MLVLCQSLNGSHKIALNCKKGVEQKQRHLAAEESRAITARAFSTYRRPLEMVPPFKYLGRVLLATETDWQ